MSSNPNHSAKVDLENGNLFNWELEDPNPSEWEFGEHSFFDRKIGDRLLVQEIQRLTNKRVFSSRCTILEGISNRDCETCHVRPVNDYFTNDLAYSEHVFWRRFRM